MMIQTKIHFESTCPKCGGKIKLKFAVMFAQKIIFFCPHCDETLPMDIHQGGVNGNNF